MKKTTISRWDMASMDSGVVNNADTSKRVKPHLCFTNLHYVGLTLAYRRGFVFV